MLLKLIRTIAFITFMAGAMLADGGHVTAAGQRRAKKPRPTSTARYVCPMDADVSSAKPGRCPKCGMTLRSEKKEAGGGAAATADETTQPPADENAALAPPKIPDITVLDQNGKRLNFYTDLVKGKVVAINFIFTTCTGVCPPLTATFRGVQRQLETEAGRDVRLISISVDPTVDTPERLRDFAAKFNAGPGWTFVTGEKIEIDSLLRALGAAVSSKTDHTPMILVGNDRVGHWTRAYGLSSPTALVKVITETADHK